MRSKTMDQGERERYVRWQGYRTTQLSFSINLFLGFAVASLAYAINLKLNGTPFPANTLEPVILAWSASALFGCTATVSKLMDYRYTARKIKYGSSGYKTAAKVFGYITWASFWIELGTYATGAYVFIHAVICA